MAALKLALGLPHGTFTDLITNEGSVSEIRLNHYPPIEVVKIKVGL